MFKCDANDYQIPRKKLIVALYSRAIAISLRVENSDVCMYACMYVFSWDSKGKVGIPTSHCRHRPVFYAV